MSKPKQITLDRDTKVLCVTAKSFPEGITDAFDRLNNLIPFAPERKIYGLSRPENGGDIVYRAAAEELNKEEADTAGISSLTIKKGNYTGLEVKDFVTNPLAIKNAFDTLLKEPNLDPHGFCVECYASDMKSVMCMIRLDE